MQTIWIEYLGGFRKNRTDTGNRIEFYTNDEMAHRDKKKLTAIRPEFLIRQQPLKIMYEIRHNQ